MLRRYIAHTVERLTGASARQLRYWDQIGLARPSLQGTNGVPGHPRFYSETDVQWIAKIVAATHSGFTLQHIHTHGVPDFIYGGYFVCSVERCNKRGFYGFPETHLLSEGVKLVEQPGWEKARVG